LSLSKPSLTNPATRFFSWKGSEGNLVWYDKEKKHNFVMNLPFEFIVLDQLHTITGFSDIDQSSYWSNEIRNITTDNLIVRTSRGIHTIGLYKEIADERGRGAKYAKSVYIAYKEKGSFVIANIKMSGSALTAWINFCKTCNVLNGKTRLTGSEEGHKGTTIFQIPTFEYDHYEGDEYSIAVDLDKKLQLYLDQYLSTKQSDDDVVIEDITSEQDNLLPENGKAALRPWIKDDDAEALSLYQSIAEYENEA
jgi:hypothetical protein